LRKCPPEHSGSTGFPAVPAAQARFGLDPTRQKRRGGGFTRKKHAQTLCGDAVAIRLCGSSPIRLGAKMPSGWHITVAFGNAEIFITGSKKHHAKRHVIRRAHLCPCVYFFKEMAHWGGFEPPTP